MAIARQKLETTKMNHKKKIEGNCLILKLEGDLIGEDQGLDIIEIVNDSISDEIINCIIDIENVGYINSSGIGVLITILTKFRNRNGDVALVGPSQNVKKLLIITKLNAIFTISETLEEAKKKLI